MKGPTKPGWYWVRFREDDEWVVDRANLKASTGELWWWAYGGRVTDRDVVEWQALQPPSKAGTPKPPLTDPAVTANTDSTYVEPANPSPRSFLAKTRKCTDGSHTDISDADSTTTGGADRKVRSGRQKDAAPDRDNRTDGRTGQESPAVPSGVFRLYGQRVIVSAVAKRGRGFSYAVANESTPKRIRYVPVTVWNKEAKPA